MEVAVRAETANAQRSDLERGTSPQHTVADAASFNFYEGCKWL